MICLEIFEFYFIIDSDFETWLLKDINSCLEEYSTFSQKFIPWKQIIDNWHDVPRQEGTAGLQRAERVLGAGFGKAYKIWHMLLPLQWNY
jgi:hypothetical protein